MSVWLRNLRLALQHKNVILLHGNVRDRYIDENGRVFEDLRALLEEVARNPGVTDLSFDEILLGDPTGNTDNRGRQRRISLNEGRTTNIPMSPPNPGGRPSPTDGLSAAPPSARVPTDEKPSRFLARWIEELTSTDQNRFAVLFYLDKLVAFAPAYSDPEKQTLLWLEKLVEKISSNHRLILVALQDSMVPIEIYTQSPKCRVLPIPIPDKTDRERYLTRELPSGRTKQVQDVAALTDGLYLREIQPLSREIADKSELGQSELSRLVNGHRIGIEKDYWGEISVDKLATAFDWFTKDQGVKGQDQAVDHVLNVLYRARAGLSGLASGTAAKPKGVLFFAGPTGTGKTLLAKKLAQFLFGTEDAFIRIDMSELMEEHSVSKLIGSPPGYIGSDRGGMLTNAVREKPFSVVLFDEIEKAHTKILDVFLQIFDEGRLTDSRGQTVFFTETIIVLTSNVGCRSTDNSSERRPVGERARWEALRAETALPVDERREQIRAHFVQSVEQFFVNEISRPELLNRIGSNIIPFNSIDSNDVQREIINSHMKRIATNFADIRRALGDRLVIDDSLVDYLLKRYGQQMAQFGGRGITNIIEEQLIRELSLAILRADHQQRQGTTFKALARDGAIKVERD